MSVLESRSSIIKVMSENDVITTGLIQTLCYSLEFIVNETLLVSLIKYIRKNILLPKRAAFTSAFCQNAGLANYFNILHNCQNNTLLSELILNSFTELSEAQVFCSFVTLNENYVQAFWELIDLFIDAKTKNIILCILENLIKQIDQSIVFSLKLKERINRIVNR